MSIRSRRFVALDSWRGICALLVAAFHFPAANTLTENPIVSTGQLFVDFFFVLSGFVIAANYSERLSTPQEVGTFLWLRIGRLYPLHLAVFLAYFIFEAGKAIGGAGDAFSGDRTLGMAVSNLFLVHSLGLHPDVSWNRPSWSISCELFAYVAFAAMTLAAGRWRWIAYALAALASVAVLAVFNGAHLIAMHDFGFFRCLIGFIAGVFVWRMWKTFEDRETHLRLDERAWTVLEVGIVLIVGIYVVSFVSGWPSLLTPIVFGAVVFVFAVERGALSRILQRPAMTFLGLLSYSLYMTHQFIIDRMLNVAVVLDQRLPFDLLAYDEAGLVMFSGATPYLSEALTIVFLASVILTSWVTYTLIEAPFRDKFRAIHQRGASRRAA